MMIIPEMSILNFNVMYTNPFSSRFAFINDQIALCIKDFDQNLTILSLQL